MYKKPIIVFEGIEGSGKSLHINSVASYLKKKGADFHFITASENNAWLLNIRGKDSDYSPIPESYILIIISIATSLVLVTVSKLKISNFMNKL